MSYLSKYVTKNSPSLKFSNPDSVGVKNRTVGSPVVNLRYLRHPEHYLVRRIHYEIIFRESRVTYIEGQICSVLHILGK